MLLLFEFFNLLLQTLDDFLTKVGALGKLLLNLFMNLDISLKSLNLSLHFVVLEEQLFSLL